MKTIPEPLAVRAVNQYQRRDVVGYLGLRLYLDNACAPRDRWIERVACPLAMHDSPSCYHVALHFKERNPEKNTIDYRRIYVPTPNEILAETALLAQCAEAPCCSHRDVYSYKLSGTGDRRGVFQPYFIGFRQRHMAIAQSLKASPGSVVLYTDIRRFYPSIQARDARLAWSRLASCGQLPKWTVELGYRLLEDYAGACTSEEKGVLTGPMFSHFIASLVLQDIDARMGQALTGGYFRYVDDIALVGSEKKVRDAEALLESLLNELGLSSNQAKRFLVSDSHWLQGEHDFAGEKSHVSWKSFVGRMKQLSLARPELMPSLTHRLTKGGFRIKPLDYSDVVTERSYLKRFSELLSLEWLQRQLYKATPEQTYAEAVELRTRYQEGLWQTLQGASQLEGYDRKRTIHRLRCYASRLVYLAAPENVKQIARALAEIPEMELYSVVFDAVDSGDVGRAVHYGANAAHSLARVLLSSKPTVACSSEEWPDAARQARAVLVAHGLKVQGKGPDLPNAMERFCEWSGKGAVSAGESGDYFGVFSCLHGFGAERRHEGLLSRAFDADEDMIVDIENVLQQSY